jgi:hypothetical protein
VTAVISAVISAVAVAVAVISFVFTRRLQSRTAELSRKPILVFVYGKKGWYLQNVGYGPALNVLMSRRPAEPENSPWIECVRIPPLSSDAKGFPISWAPYVAKNLWRATYEDIAGRPYTSQCVRDENTIYNEFKPPRWKEEDIQRAWEMTRLSPDSGDRPPGPSPGSSSHGAHELEPVLCVKA